jgi:hypothetical protein
MDDTAGGLERKLLAISQAGAPLEEIAFYNIRQNSSMSTYSTPDFLGWGGQKEAV